MQKHARKMDATIIEKTPKREPKRDVESIKSKNRCEKRVRKKRDTAKTQRFFNTARLSKYLTFRASPSEGTAENHLHKNSSQVGCVIGRAHAKAEAQHASGASGPGRILSCLRQHTRPGPRKGGFPTVEILE